LGATPRAVRCWIERGRLKGKIIQVGPVLRVYRVDMRSLDDVYKAVCRKCGREFKTGNHPEQSAFCGRQCKNDWFMAILKEERRRITGTPEAGEGAVDPPPNIV